MPPLLSKTCRRIVAISSATLLLTNTVWATSTSSRPRLHNNPSQSGHSIIHVGPLVYFFMDGLFYRHGPRGYVVAPAPAGAVIKVLPAGAILVTMDGEPYYTYSGIFYKKVPKGYVVVTQPALKTVPAFAVGQKLQVTVDLLNVRSGPGLNHGIVQQIGKGTIVKVEAHDSNWCFIRINEQTTGWIKSVYTSPLVSAAKG